MRVIGVDPGGSSTGVVTRAGDQLLAWAVVRRQKNEDDGDFLGRVLDEVEDQIVAHDVPAIALERVNAPGGFARGAATGHRTPIALKGLVGTAAVYGALLGVYRHAYVVAPSGHGSNGRGAYPIELWGATEGDAGTGFLRHARSAWDVAGAVAFLAQVEAATG